MTTFNDGPIMRQSVMSVLNQTYEDLELIIVDDGSGPETKAVLDELADPRVRVLPQANDGVSSARNRGLHHAVGDYICFLDADDVRSPWAFAEVARTIEKTEAELILVRGVFSGERTKLEAFFDEPQALKFIEELNASDSADLATRKAWAVSLEPQPANKFIARSVIERGKLRFPNDHFFEDILFHAMTIAHARSIELIDSRSYTYFQRQLHRQTTGSNGTIRFDIIGTARVTLQLFQEHPDFGNARQRGALMLSVLRLLRWCEENIAVYHRFAFRMALRETFRGINPLYFILPENTPDPRDEREDLSRYAREIMV
jgi:glycosyltransferase involved in cell wall biosynthesis